MRAIEATESLEPLLAELDKGDSLEIRRGNVPVAFVFAPRHAVSGKRVEHDPVKIRQAIEDLKQLQDVCRLDGLKIKDLINEGRP